MTRVQKVRTPRFNVVCNHVTHVSLTSLDMITQFLICLGHSLDIGDLLECSGKNRFQPSKGIICTSVSYHILLIRTTYYIIHTCSHSNLDARRIAELLISESISPRLVKNGRPSEIPPHLVHRQHGYLEPTKSTSSSSPPVR
jgi:hypothetical protein